MKHQQTGLTCIVHVTCDKHVKGHVQETVIKHYTNSTHKGFRHFLSGEPVGTPAFKTLPVAAGFCDGEV